MYKLCLLAGRAQGTYRIQTDHGTGAGAGSSGDARGCLLEWVMLRIEVPVGVSLRNAGRGIKKIDFDLCLGLDSG